VIAHVALNLDVLVLEGRWPIQFKKHDLHNLLAPPSADALKMSIHLSMSCSTPRTSDIGRTGHVPRKVAGDTVDLPSM
jgi:hypothetical protein